MEEDPQIIEDEGEKKIELKAIKIRLFPTKKQQKTLFKWFNTARWTYNQCVDSFQTKKVKANKKDLRAMHVNNENFDQNNKWVPDTPYDIRDEAMNDFLKALKATKAKKNLKKFHFKFRRKKDPTQSIAVLKKHWGHKRGVYSDIFDSKKMKAEMDLPKNLEHDSRLIRTRLNRYYLCIPVPIEVKCENQAPNSKKHCTISLDPGVRTFMTGYDADGSTFEWAKDDFGRIFRLCYAYDRLQAKWSKVKHHQRSKMKIAGLRIQSKIRNLVDEVHKKLSKCLCENYRKILLPVFETSNMVKRGCRKLHKKTARAMLTWSHFRFRQRLLSKSREYPWCKVILTEEPYTSKTCGECGTINTTLGSQKTFKCQECEYISDRDINGARNILLRHLTKRGLVPKSPLGLPPSHLIMNDCNTWIQMKLP
jgi:transposase